MGFWGKTLGFDFEDGGREALIRNIKTNPQIATGDPKFDNVAKDIFERMAAGDPKVLKWDDQFKTIVGLYDQATQGFPQLFTLSDLR